MVYLGIYLSVYFLIVVLTTIKGDDKFDTWESRLLLSIIFGWAWPIMVIMSIGLVFEEYRENVKTNKELTQRKIDLLFNFLEFNNKDQEYVQAVEIFKNDFIRGYLISNNPDGLKLLDNKKVYLTEFAHWIIKNVKYQTHEYGFCYGACEWYTKNS